MNGSQGRNTQGSALTARQQLANSPREGSGEVRVGQPPARSDKNRSSSATDGTPPFRQPAADTFGLEELPLLTPSQAAAQLAVPESWLRRKAGRRLVPCTFIGRHLRFSAADVRAIAAAGSQPARPPRSPHFRH